MKKIIFSILFFSLENCSLFAQNQNFFFGPPVPMGYQKLGAAKGIAGVIGDNYYVIENDYGSRLDFSNNIRTIVTRFSISEGKFKSRFNLNELIANSRKEINQILFCDVITWKGNIVGFYTYKNPGGKNFLASGMVCDPNGKLIKDGIDIGDFEHDYVNGSFLWQGGLLVNGRNTLSVVKDLQYRLTPDSSKIIVLCSAPTDGTDNVKFKTYDYNLVKQKEIVATIPLKEKVADMIDFAMDNNGNVYVVTKTYKSKTERKKVSDDDDNYFELHVLNTHDNNKVTTWPLDIAGKAINVAELGLKNNNRLYCFGNYSNIDNKKSKGNITGVFSLAVSPDKPALSIKSHYDLPDSVVEYLDYDNKKHNGISQKYALYDLVPESTGGMFVVIASEVGAVTVRGTTGAMNSYNEMTKSMIITSIGNDQKIKWTTGMRTLAGNAVMLTRANRPCFLEKDHELLCTFTAANARTKQTEGLWLGPVDQADENSKFISVFPIQYRKFKVLEKSLLPIGNDEYITAMFDNQLSIIKFKVE